jgi:hypothetical protein
VMSSFFVAFGQGLTGLLNIDLKFIRLFSPCISAVKKPNIQLTGLKTLPIARFVQSV